ncbi:hypothetical protein [Elizabethkingia miricola]|uniref:Uncharacterized protein n=1 Tax=Elizabethkingia miricola TaxID=172045 RepID=A0ABD5B4N7_ELIMR|nr:hypothetical protein [Elizabethkingia miricola]MDQ8748349.1 hypothetical protein [Elizabethkingia miricola]
MNRIVKVIMSDGETLEFKEKSLESFATNGYSKSTVERLFNGQHGIFEEEILSKMNIDLEDWAKEEYSLVDEDEVKGLDDFSDDEIRNEATYRTLFKDKAVHNQNILNSEFIDRFIEIINRGDDFQIDNALTMLEKNYKIK